MNNVECPSEVVVMVDYIKIIVKIVIVIVVVATSN